MQPPIMFLFGWMLQYRSMLLKAARPLRNLSDFNNEIK